MSIEQKIKKRLDFIYKAQYDNSIIDVLVESVEAVKHKINLPQEKWSEQDVVLITYGDSILGTDKNPLQTLKTFLDKYLGEAISYVHILPFFPYSSDDGFSVIDYKVVDPALGNWSDVAALNESYKLMFDLVINHASQYSKWFQNYLQGKSPGKDYFIEADPKSDLSGVVRPRSLPLLTPAKTPDGIKHVWTTFSDDQIDLNFAQPQLLVEMVKIFLFYLEKGASMIRLDAIAFLWKEIGTNCLHLPETHEFVKLLRDITDYLSSGFILLTETNVPNKENLSYFGENDEANMVYQFSLPPLLVHALYTGNSKYLSSWASEIPDLSAECTFFNFTASHDGIGVRPLEGIVPKTEFNKVIEGMKSFGGKINMKRNADGTESPYEMNITYFDALKGTEAGIDTFQESRFICSQTIMMSMEGVPAFYIHSLLGTRNYIEGVEETKMNRTINRRKWQEKELNHLLDADSHHKRVLTELLRRINVRKQHKVFHPDNIQRVLNIDENVFAVSRGGDAFYSISNISSTEIQVELSRFIESSSFTDILTQVVYDKFDGQTVLAPYQTLWLVKK